jgi:deoxyadenosine/deoxycytidine kinase
MKIVIFGPSSAGKTTLGKALSNKLGVPIIEADEEVKKLNNGIWPNEEKTIDTYFDKINTDVLLRKNIIYIISWLEKDRIFEFNKVGFHLINLRGDFEVLLARRIRRDNPKKHLIDRFRNNYFRYLKIVNDSKVSSAFLLDINTTGLNSEEVLDKAYTVLHETLSVEKLRNS